MDRRHAQDPDLAPRGKRDAIRSPLDPVSAADCVYAACPTIGRVMIDVLDRRTPNCFHLYSQFPILRIWGRHDSLLGEFAGFAVGVSQPATLRAYYEQTGFRRVTLPPPPVAGGIPSVAPMLPLLPPRGWRTKKLTLTDKWGVVICGARLSSSVLRPSNVSRLRVDLYRQTRH